MDPLDVTSLEDLVACQSVSDCVEGNEVPQMCYSIRAFWVESAFPNLFSNQTAAALIADPTFLFAFCDCANFYGFTGNDCTEPSGATAFLRACYLVYGLFAAGVNIWLGYLLRMFLCRWVRPGADVYRAFRLPTAVSIVSFNFLATFFEVINCAFNLTSLFDPSKLQMVEQRTIQFKYQDISAYGGRLVSFVTYSQASLSLITTAWVLLSWLEIINYCSLSESPKTKRNYRVAAVAARIFTVIFVLSFLILPLAGFDGVIGMMITASVVFLIILTIVARCRFIRVMAKFSERIKVDMKKPLTLIKRVSLAHILVLIGTLVMVPMLYIYYAQKYILFAPGTLNLAIIAQMISLALAQCTMGINAVYGTKLIYGLKNNHEMQSNDRRWMKTTKASTDDEHMKGNNMVTYTNLIPNEKVNKKAESMAYDIIKNDKSLLDLVQDEESL